MLWFGFRARAHEISVRDGDSIWWRRGGWGADGKQTDRARKFRLAGYDAPEIGERAKSAHEAEWGQDAKTFIERKIAEASKLRIKPVGQTRFENTEPAVLYIDGKDAKDIMVEANMGGEVEWRGEHMVRPKWDQMKRPGRRLGVIIVAAAALAVASGMAVAQTVTTTAGGPIRTILSAGIVLNKESSLSRTWITVHDPDMLVEFARPTGVRTVYKARNYSGDYQYNALFDLVAKEAISAVEVRFLVFDIWGQHRRTLVGTEVADVAAKATKKLDFSWNLFSETEAAEHYASIAYVSRVRTQDGRILAANTKFVLDQARKFSVKFTEGDLEPKKDQK